VSLEAAGASLRSAVKTVTCIICKEKRTDATAIVGWGVASAQAGVWKAWALCGETCTARS